MNGTKHCLFFLALASSIFFYGIAFGAEDSVPTSITADSLRYDLGDRILVFEGSVQVDREDIRMKSKILFVRFSSDGKATDGNALAQNFDPGNIERIEARDEVVINYQGRVGYCGLATYDVAAGLLTLEQNPEIRDGENSIRGEVIRFYLKENRSEVVGGGDNRVQAVFTTPKGAQTLSNP